MPDFSTPIDISGWPTVAKAFGVVFGGASGLALLGKALDVLFPTAAQRQDAERNRRLDAAAREAALEHENAALRKELADARRELHDKAEEVVAVNDRYFRCREERATALGELSAKTALLEELRAKLGQPSGVRPENVPSEPRPPLIDDRPRHSRGTNRESGSTGGMA